MGAAFAVCPVSEASPSAGASILHRRMGWFHNILKKRLLTLVLHFKTSQLLNKTDSKTMQQ